jgi:hypothetical protein
MDAGGNKIWDRSYGGSAADAPIAFELMPDGGCVVLGVSSSPANGNKTNALTGNWIFRVDAAGNKLWEYVVTDFSPLNLRLLDNGQLLISFANSSLLLSANGQFVAAHMISPPGTVLSTLSRAITPDGGVIGYNRAQSTVVRYNGTNIAWSRPYTNFTEVYAATRTGGFIGEERQAFPGNYSAVVQIAPDALTAKPRLSMDYSFATNSGVYHLGLHGVSNHFYAVDRTTDFVSWVPLATNFLGSNSLSASITASNPAAFFRARLVP